VTGNTFEDMYPIDYGGTWYPSHAFELWGGEWGTAVSTDVTISGNTVRFDNQSNTNADEHGVRLRSGADAANIHVNYNEFYDGGTGTTAAAARNQGSGTLDAEMNYWGCAASVDPVTECGTVFVGDVDYCPWVNTAGGTTPVYGTVCTPPDTEGPITSNVVADPNPVPVDPPTDIHLTANVDDSTTGGSNIDSAEYTIDGGPWTAMSAMDMAFDAVNEDVEATIDAFTEPGVHEICVRGTDTVGNTGPQECILLAAYDPTAGFVTGGGWIWSPAGAYGAEPELEGKANFGFVSKYKKGANVPEGSTEFQFKAGNLNFHSTSYDWLVVTGSDYARFKGTGTINGAGDYKFMLWAGDGDPDTFRIKIWWEDDTEHMVYDNGMDQAIGGGQIVVHTGRK
jgi:hypothetical protein